MALVPRPLLTQTPLRSLYLEKMQNGGQTDSTARCCKSGNYVGRKGWIVCEMDVKDGLGTFHCVRRIAEHIALLRAREMKIMQNVPKASRPPYGLKIDIKAKILFLVTMWRKRVSHVCNKWLPNKR